MLSTDNEIDGETLIGLTETMIARLLPTMKKQVRFMALLEGLRQLPLHEEDSLSVAHETTVPPLQSVRYLLLNFIDMFSICE